MLPRHALSDHARSGTTQIPKTLTDSTNRHTVVSMSQRRRVSFFLDSDLEAGLKGLKGKVGIPQAEAIRRAIAEYLERQGVAIDSRAERKRAVTRKRP